MEPIEAARSVFEHYQREVRPEATVVVGRSATLVLCMHGYRVSLAVFGDGRGPEWSIEGGGSTGGATAGLVARPDSKALAGLGGLLIQFSNLLTQIGALSR